MGKPEPKAGSTPKASGGSALKKLKSTLKEAGFLGPKQKAAKNRHARSAPASRAAGAANAVQRQSLKSLALSRSNPFELQFTRSKHDVLNRKVKGQQGRPGLVRKRGEETRKRSLGLELGRRNKTSAFVDRRFGEKDKNMSVEDKMLERFMKEKMRRSARGGMFNLDDDEGDDGAEMMELTHKGLSLSSEAAFKDAGFQRVGDDSDEEGNGQIDKDTVKYSHFGGFSDEEGEVDADGKHKSKNDVMKEIIAKSKAHKRERQMQKVADEELADEVDAQLDDVRALLANKEDRDRAEAREARLKALKESEAGRDEKVATPAFGELNDYSDYDQLVRTLSQDRRAKPTDRLKTDEELALEAKTELEQLERDRERRMQGLPSLSQADKRESRRKRKQNDVKPNRDAQADDLGNDQYVSTVRDMDEADEEVALTYKDGVLTNDKIFMSGNVGNGDDSDDEENESGSDDDDDDEDDAEEDQDDDENEDLDREAKLARVQKILQENDDDLDEEDDIDGLSRMQTAAISDTQAADELPYTFEAPATHAEYLTLIRNRSVSDQATILQRLRILFNPKLGAGNRQKLETLLCILFEHVEYICTTQSDQAIDTLNGISIHLIELARQFPTLAAETIIALLKVAHKRSNSLLARPKAGTSSWPSTSTLALFKLVSRIFSTSDLVHPVVTPTYLLLTSYLSLCQIQTVQDAIMGLGLCEVLVEYEVDSRRYVPEMINFLSTVIGFTLPVDNDNEMEIGDVPVQNAGWKGLRIENFEAIIDPEAPPLSTYLFTPSYVPDPTLNIRILEKTLQILSAVSKFYTLLPSYTNVFTPILSLLSKIPTSGALEPILSTLTQSITTTLASAPLKLRPLKLQSHKPIPIQSYLPKFASSFSLDRKSNPAHMSAQQRDLVQTQKLKAEHKKEQKGAVRELRKDAVFLARERLRKQKEGDAAYKKKMDKIVGQLASQEGAMRGYERDMEKARGKKRR
ncbi:nucleolar protein 14 [Phlyctochytrium arcticum]|nr:nucleolar protein 14 [Phlyctochytrium arcticum]